MPGWLTLVYLTLILALIAGRAWRRSKSDFVRYGLIWLVIIAAIALLYDVAEPRFTPAKIHEAPKSEGSASV